MSCVKIMKILFTGDRNWKDIEAVKWVFEWFKPTIIIHGACRGLDTIAGNIAKELKIAVESHPADWAKYKNAAGVIRNIEMIKKQPDIVIAFHDDIENSKGTKHCVTNALKASLKVYLCKHKDNVITIENYKERELIKNETKTKI